jgi:hypothetical protein
MIAVSNTRLSKTLDDILAWMEYKQEIRRRDYWERRLLRRIRLSLDGQYEKVMPMLGDPPRLENIPASFWEGAGIEFTRQVRPVLEEVFMQQAADMIQTVPIGVDWALVNTGAVEWARKYTFELVKGINETTREALGKIIGEAFEKDLTRAELEQLIGELYNPIRSEMIAITEVTRASNEGTTEIRKELSEQGIEMIPVWNTRNDELVCDICGPLNDQKADHFTDDGEPVWIHPETGEEIEHTPHPRCRCSYGLELPDE